MNLEINIFGTTISISTNLNLIQNDLILTHIYFGVFHDTNNFVNNEKIGHLSVNQSIRFPVPVIIKY